MNIDGEGLGALRNASACTCFVSHRNFARTLPPRDDREKVDLQTEDVSERSLWKRKVSAVNEMTRLKRSDEDAEAVLL
jgi:hypothetical protein